MFEVTGDYDFTYAAFTLPERIVVALLPPSWEFSTDEQLVAASLSSVPQPGQGRRYVCIQIGRQHGTGPNLPLGIGKNTFYVRHFERYLETKAHSASVAYYAGRQARGTILASSESIKLAINTCHLQADTTVLVRVDGRQLQCHDRPSLSQGRVRGHQ